MFAEIDTLRACAGKSFDETSPTFDLKTLNDLHLDEFEEDVGEIVNRAQKEEKMEFALEKISKTWKVLEFQFAQHKDTDIHMIKLSEEDFETLEDHQLQIQNMMGSRYLATFEEQVTKWQHDLASVADVVGLMSEIQRTWAYLETLFIGSEEVKKELPVDAERFVGIDVDVKQVLQFLTWLSFCTKFTWFICATAVKTNVPIVCPTLSDVSDIWTRCSRTSVE